MALRITTWNVNGIRNPFGYQPWRDKRTFDGMFDILEADIICLQETKIQRKDLRDDMVLVPGFDCYWSLPRHKKGYSGVVIYTRNAKCTPIRAEEGIAGGLCPPNTSTPFRDLPASEQIGGYPSQEQMSEIEFDAATLDAEGRCVILEFPAFVLIGTYCPAERDDTRTHFRTAFLKILDSRIRNLVRLQKKVVWIGDLNISRAEIDTAMSDEMMRKNGVDHVGWISTPARRLLNQLLVGGEVHGERDEGREEQILWDVCRDFHKDRKGMYTCWETKTNARPGNYGARIDYVVCSFNMKEWWSDSNIQEGLMGSDHCPVFGLLKEKIDLDGRLRHTVDLMNPPGMFVEGVRQIEWSTKNLLPMSGKLIEEFDKRRSIKDMFTRTSLVPKSAPTTVELTRDQSSSPLKFAKLEGSPSELKRERPRHPPAAESLTQRGGVKRGASATTSEQNTKRLKSDAVAAAKGQQSLTGFFTRSSGNVEPSKSTILSQANQPDSITSNTVNQHTSSSADEEVIATSFEAKKSWSKLFAKPIAPKCEHDEPCKTMLTKKPGVNCGRSFWMCNRPLGPSGNKERDTQWRCQTFIWASDWDARNGVE